MKHLSRSVVAAAVLALVAGTSACDVPFVGSGGGQDSDTTSASEVKADLDDGAGKCAEQLLEPMDREQRAGQLMLVGVPVGESKRAIPWLARFHLGGVLLTGNISAGVGGAGKAITRLREASPDDVRPFVGVTQEGGDASTMQGKAFGDLPDALSQAAWTPQETVDRIVETARALTSVGINLTLSPVTDVVPGSATENPLGPTRAFGSDVNDVATQIHLTVQSFESQKVATTLKHFPGYARLKADPDEAAAEDAKLEIDDPQLVPFVTGIEAGADVVQMSAATYSALDDQPAVFSSKVVTDLLRKVVNFKGVVLSSDLSADGAIKDVKLADRGVAFVKAGGDLVLSADAGAADDLLGGIVAEDAKDPEFAKLVDASALRILTAKAARGIVTCG